MRNYKSIDYYWLFKIDEFLNILCIPIIFSKKILKTYHLLIPICRIYCVFFKYYMI